ncbi:MAG: spore coat protein U domain-containing protein [Candidatus Geothermincolia bacterium]
MFVGVLLLEARRAIAANNATVAVSATVISKSNCKFATNAAALGFGTLDPANPVNVTRTATLTVRCGGSSANATYLITDDDGLHESGPGAERMRHTVTLTEFLPYGFSYAPASATITKNTNQTITITGMVTGANYQNALVGNFADTVTLTVVP